jgi:hypothetical protein
LGVSRIVAGLSFIVAAFFANVFVGVGGIALIIGYGGVAIVQCVAKRLGPEIG